MKYIKTTKNRNIIVDDEDYESLSSSSWCIQSKKYAASRIGGKLVLMHRMILGANRGEYVDHINGNGLDNRKENLRICTQSQNLQNQAPVRGGTSRFKGVSWDKANKKWVVHLTVNKKTISVGRFATEVEAANAYDKSAIFYCGQYARTNGEVY